MHSSHITSVEIYNADSLESSGIIDPAQSTISVKPDAKLRNFFNLASETEEDFAKRLKLATGWERGTDGKWRYEEADSLLDDAQINRMKDGASRLLGNILGKDNALFDSYPQLRDYWLTFMEDEDMRGDWGNISETSININDSLTNDEINRLSFTRFNTPFKELRALPLAETTEETGTMITLQERLRPGMFLYEEI